MRIWLIGAAILFAAPAHASELIANGGFDTPQTGTTIVGKAAAGQAAAASWSLYNNTNASTFSEVVASFAGRTNLLHIVTDDQENGAFQNFLSDALSGYADIYVVSGRVRVGAYTNGGMVSLSSAYSTTTNVFERLVLTANAQDPFTFISLYSSGEGAEFYIDLASASRESAPVSENAAPGVPEPATWAMMLFGFGAIGGVLRRRQTGAARIHFA